jgi:serine/threonine-protein kinase
MTEPRMLGDRYELGEVLGYGGMAEVHRGRDVRLGRDVAIKTLRADLARDASFQARFRREAQSAASLNHPSVVAVYDTGESELDGVNVPYIVMEYVDGRTLRDVLKTDRLLQPSRALEVVGEILQALDYSHRNGIVHRDIKPGNVMLTRSGDVKVMDFGIARAVAQSAATMTQTAAVIGTAQYLSPEQARGEHVDPRSDVYSVGCLLYELLTGVPPFTGDSPVAVAYQHVRENPVPPSRLNPDVTPDVDAIVMKALAKNPVNRYQSAADMRADITRALAGQRVEATPVLLDATTVMAPVAAADVVPPGSGEPPRRGRGAVYALLGLAVVAVVVLVALFSTSLLGNKTPLITVPPVIGKTQAEAETTLKKDFTVKVQQVASDKPVGEVVDQFPAAGVRLSKGKEVTIKVSAGPGTITVPGLTGMTLAQASDTLRADGLVLGKTTEENSSQGTGIVLRSDPVEGAAIAKGGTVNLVIATGNNVVPNVRGESFDSARTMLENAGFIVNEPPVEQSSTQDAGTVIAQSLSPNQVAPVKSPITLTVSSGPPTPTESPTPTETPTTPPPSTPPSSGSPTPSGSPSSSPPIVP